MKLWAKGHGMNDEQFVVLRNDFYEFKKIPFNVWSDDQNSILPIGVVDMKVVVCEVQCMLNLVV